MPKTMVGLAMLSGLRRGELFALRWRDLDEAASVFDVREAVYEGTFSTPKTAAGVTTESLVRGRSEADCGLASVASNAASPNALMFSTWSGKPISPNNVVRRWIVPACDDVGTRARDLVDAAANVLVVGAREGRAGQGRRAADGPREGRHDAQRVHAGRRWLTSQSRRHGRIRIVHYCSQTGERRPRASRWARARLAEALRWFEAASGPPTRLTSLRRDSLRTRSQAKAGSSGWTRTSNPPVNSRMLCH